MYIAEFRSDEASQSRSDLLRSCCRNCIRHPVLNLLKEKEGHPSFSAKPKLPAAHEKRNKDTDN
jgi:hypothetical protein